MFEPRKPKRKTPEATLQTRVMYYLRHEQTAYKCALTNMPHSADAGMPDVTCISPTGRYVAVELKSPNGVQSSEQKYWQKEIEKRGGQYHIVRSMEELLTALDKS